MFYYPIGIQTFANIINEKAVYVDKTAVAYDMVKTGKFNFLSRPRRFGKSLLVSTLQAYFEGRKELFRGLAMEKLETEWVQYPVLHFDMSGIKHLEKDQLEYYLLDMLKDEEVRHGLEPGKEEKNAGIRLKDLIEGVVKKTGKPAVVLIDEYDAPLLDTIHDDSLFVELRNTMRNFFSPLKKCENNLRFLFITGITKFSQLSIFSELNSLRNISMDVRYADICGITEEEMLTHLKEPIQEMADANELTFDETVARLKANYDGYHFAWPSPDVYNPFSLMYALDRQTFDAFWFESGTPTALVEMMRKSEGEALELNQPIRVAAENFDAPTERMVSMIPFLYQSGYLTIKGRKKNSDIYALGIPNREIRKGLFSSLLPNYVDNRSAIRGRVVIDDMRDFLADDDMDGALRLLQTFLGTIPFTNVANLEGHYQQLLCVIFTLFGVKVDVEVHTPLGRVDIVLMTQTKLYVMELKIDRSAQTAMAQIDLKDYDSRFALSGLPVVNVGINFSTQKRNITDWEIREA